MPVPRSSLPTVFFDFDGTLALGHGPVFAYARHAAPFAAPDLLSRLEAELLALDQGQSSFRDGYHALASLAREDGVDHDQLQVAYRRSRHDITAQTVDTMPALSGFLTELRGDARLVLATNAPSTGIPALLDSWDAGMLFDDVFFNVGKPYGLKPLIAEALRDAPVLSIGDIAVNDLLPAQEMGADAALVGPLHDHPPIPVTIHAARLENLAPEVFTWARDHR